MPGDSFLALIRTLDQLDQYRSADAIARTCSRGYVAHYPALGTSFKREDLIGSTAQRRRVADIRHRSTPLGYDEKGRLWCGSQSVVTPRDGTPATIIRAVNAYRPDDGKIAESWHWIDSRPPISAGELTDQLRRFAALKEAGALSEAEFAEKKADLLSRV